MPKLSVSALQRGARRSANVACSSRAPVGATWSKATPVQTETVW